MSRLLEHIRLNQGDIYVQGYVDDITILVSGVWEAWKICVKFGTVGIKNRTEVVYKGMLTVNPTKTSVIVFTRRGNPHQLKELKL